MNEGFHDAGVRLEGAWRFLLGDRAPGALASARGDGWPAAAWLASAIEGWSMQPAGAVDDALLTVACALPAGLSLDLPGLVSRCLRGDALASPRRRTVLAWVLGRADRASRVRLAAATKEVARWIALVEAQVARVPPWSPLAVYRLGTGMTGDSPHPPTHRTLYRLGAGMGGWRSGYSNRFATRDGGRGAGESPAILHFTLRGADVAGRTMRAGHLAELILRDGDPGSDAIHQLSSDAVDDARARDVDVLLLLSTRGEIALEGPQFARAVFVGGRLDEPLRFRLRAQRCGSGSVHVDFLVKGESVHQCEIALQVIDVRPSASELPSQADPGPGLDQLLRSMPTVPPAQQLRLSLGLPGGAFCLSLLDLRHGDMEFADDFVEPDWGRVEVEQLLRSLDTALSRCYEDVDFWSSYDGKPSADRPSADTHSCLARTMEVVVSAGAKLNRRLRESPRIAAALDYIEQNAQPGALITISTDNIFLPLEILYPGDWATNPSPAIRQAHPPDPLALWGARFAIETEKRGVGSRIEARERHRQTPPKVSLNLNPDIGMPSLPLARQPLKVHDAWARALDGDGLLESVNRNCEGMRNVLQDGDSAATLLYVFCHGESPNALAGVTEFLQLDDDCLLEPDDLRQGKVFAGAPIVVLNACSAGVSSPFVFNGFLKEFRRRGALGIIATSHAVPIVFGAHFGAELVRCALRPAGSLSAAMHALRRRHLLAGNPVPLLYTVQCQVDRA